jgi:hypothetical protein
MHRVPRIYDAILKKHLASYRQMALVCGPRQVGKTTTCRLHADAYVNWDNLDDREIILAGPGKLSDHVEPDRLSQTIPVVLLDGLHKHSRWKQFLKEFFDTYADQVKTVVTGSTRLDVYRRVGDSLMGRYLLYHMHPFSVAETLHTTLPDSSRIVRDPCRPDPADFDALWTHGGYPEPFLKRDIHFSRRWQSLRGEQLLGQDVRDLTQIQHIDQLAVLARLLAFRSGHQITYSSLAKAVRTTIDTVRRWIDALACLHYGFLIRPWYRNVTRSLRKEPKWYLRDWGQIETDGERAETFVACHLLKAVDGWNDLGYGKFELAYLRDKEKREVDFVVIRDTEPWFLVEVKRSRAGISKNLRQFQEQLGADHAFQVVINADYVDADCFARPGDPLTVPAKTFLSQLI